VLERSSNNLEFYETKYYNALEGEKRKFSTYTFNRSLAAGLYYLNNRKAILVAHENNQLEAVKPINEGKQEAAVLSKVVPPVPIQRVQTAGDFLLVSSATDFVLYADFKQATHWQNTNYSHSCIFPSGRTALANSHSLLLSSPGHSDKQVELEKG
jgi:hypothetical protein